MDLHIYDMKLDPNAVVIMTGRIGKDEIQSFSGYLKVIQSIFPNPVIYIPDDATMDAMSDDEITSLLVDSMSIESLEKLCAVVNDAFAKKSSEIIEEAKSDEV